MTLQIVSSEGTQWVSVDDVPEEARDAELAIYRKQAADEGKPENIQQKIAEGRLDKWYAEVVLLRQPYFRDESKTVERGPRRALRRDRREHRAQALRPLRGRTGRRTRPWRAPNQERADGRPTAASC